MPQILLFQEPFPEPFPFKPTFILIHFSSIRNNTVCLFFIKGKVKGSCSFLARACIRREISNILESIDHHGGSKEAYRLLWTFVALLPQEGSMAGYRQCRSVFHKTRLLSEWGYGHGQ